MTSRAAEFRDLYMKLRIADQLRWYKGRSKEYKRASQQAIGVRNALLILAAAAGFVGQFTTSRGTAALGVVAAVLAALAAAVTAYEALIGFAKLSKLYDDTVRNLSSAAIDWSDLGADDDMAAQFGKVEQIFRTENGQWGQLVPEGTPPDPTAGTGTGGS